MAYTTIIEKFNPYHDKLGRFCGAEGASFMTYRTKDSKKQHMADLAIERAKESQNKKTTSMPEDRTQPVKWKNIISKCESMDELKKVLEEHLPGVVEIADKYKNKSFSECCDKKTKGDLVLYDIFEKRGFDAKPTEIYDWEIEAYSETFRTKVFYRGFNRSSSTGITGKDKADMFIEGKTYAGFGVCGNGTYAASVLASDSQKAYNTAKSYSGGEKDGIIKFTVQTQKNWGNAEDIETERKSLISGVKKYKKTNFSQTDGSQADPDHGKEEQELLDSLVFVATDTGRYAALRGYDGYHCGTGNIEDDYNVILNHGNIIVSDKRYE